MILPEILCEDFVDDVIRIVLIHLDFFENHTALPLDVFRLKDWTEYKVAQYVQCDRKMFVENFDVEADAFFRGEGIHVSADGVHLPRNIFGRAVLCALEDHVLDEMRNAIPLWIFLARPGLDPYSDRDRADVLHFLADDGQPIGQYFTTNISCFFSHL